MNVLGIIPVRLASTRLKEKPLIELGGKTLIEWVYFNSKIFFNNLYIAVDDQKIFNHCKAFTNNVLMTSVYHKSGTDRCGEAVLTIEKITGKTYDIVVNIQGDQPFIQCDQFSILLEPFNNTDVQISTLIKAIETDDDLFDPNKPKVVIDNNKNALYFSRHPIPYIKSDEKSTWLSKHTFYKHIGLYAFRKNILLELIKLKPSSLEEAESLEQLRWIENGYKIKCSITHSETLSIDTEQDLYKANEYLKSYKC
ncbi:MAG: 3-deoxy-manno-octulosonate cytidylyltransferase [Bacteroidales bacterium]|nr:3-deoxy-manno-octulosonate cytidylyltransferase [Bacteroidales bacterium]